MSKPRLLWCGDHSCSTGFARVSHAVLSVLQHYWDTSVLALNYFGDPTPFDYDVYPAYPGGDFFGVNRIQQICNRVRPDLVVIQNDPWNVPTYLKEIKDVPVVASMPVDGLNCRGEKLNGLASAIFWTQHGLEQAQAGGYRGPATIIPLGVDLNTFKPADKLACRQLLQLPEEVQRGFIVGNVNRNQLRKRLDLTVKYFAEWVINRQIEDAYLFFHTGPTGDGGWDLEQLAAYYKIPNRLILMEPNAFDGVTEETLAATYNSFDLQVTTTQGEGWGLPTLEGMACGVPQIVPDWAALGEWCKYGAIKIRCNTTAATHHRINVIGGVPDRDPFITSLELLYRGRETREHLGRRARELAEEPQFRWGQVGLAFHSALSAVLEKEQLTAVS